MGTIQQASQRQIRKGLPPAFGGKLGIDKMGRYVYNYTHRQDKQDERINTMTAQIKKAIRSKLQALGFDVVTYGKDGTWTAKKGYFYPMGRTPQKLAELITANIPAVTVVAMEDAWRTWPQTSYHVVKFTVDAAAVLNA